MAIDQEKLLPSDPWVTVLVAVPRDVALWLKEGDPYGEAGNKAFFILQAAYDEARR